MIGGQESVGPVPVGQCHSHETQQRPTYRQIAAAVPRHRRLDAPDRQLHLLPIHPPQGGPRRCLIVIVAAAGPNLKIGAQET